MRRLLALSFVLVALIAGLLAGPVVAGTSGNNRPVVSVTAGTPADGSVTVTASINRWAKQIDSCLYGVDAVAAIDCGAGASDAAGTTFTISLTDQEVGEHTVTVKVTLTDGGGATGSAGFTIEAEAQYATLDVTKTEDGATPTDSFRFQLAGGPGNIDDTKSTTAGDGNLEWADVAAGDYTLCERAMPASMHSSLEDAPYDGTREPDGAGAVKICTSLTLAARQTRSIPVDNIHGRLAVAWTDANDDHAFEAATDTLIAKLVDTNGDGVVSMGDTVTTNEFPRDHAGTTFEPATVTSFDVTSTPIVTSGRIVVGTTAGLFEWIAGDLEQYQELTIGGGFIALTDDPSACDRITLEQDSPSEIATPGGDATCDGVNSSFLDVAIDVP